MSCWTKLEIIRQAFEVIGLASYVFDIQSDSLQTGLRMLDTMIANWESKGIRLGYPLPSCPGDSNIEEDSGIPESSVEAVYTNLAIRIAPSYGKAITPELRSIAAMAYKDLFISSAKPPYERQFPETLPKGAGNKPWRDSGDVFNPPPIDPLLAGDDDIIEFD